MASIAKHELLSFWTCYMINLYVCLPPLITGWMISVNLRMNVVLFEAILSLYFLFNYH
jgi:hypothetical protein